MNKDATSQVISKRRLFSGRKRGPFSDPSPQLGHFPLLELFFFLARLEVSDLALNAVSSVALKAHSHAHKAKAPIFIWQAALQSASDLNNIKRLVCKIR